MADAELDLINIITGKTDNFDSVDPEYARVELTKIVSRTPDFDPKCLTSYLAYLNPNENDTIVILSDFLLSSVFYPNVTEAFSEDKTLSNQINNRLNAQMAEAVVFATMQRRNLKDNAAYNRHLEKSLDDIRRHCALLISLGATYEELVFIFEKYLEFVQSVNTSWAWNDFYALRQFYLFEDFTDEHKNELIDGFNKGKLHCEALRPFKSEKEVKALLKSFYEEMKTEDPARAKEIENSGLLD